MSIDFHKVLDVAQAGDSGAGVIHQVNKQLLENFSDRFGDLGYTVAVCSYIGEGGRQSSERRSALLATIRDFNQGKQQSKRLGLRIVSRSFEKASCLKSAGVVYHADDRQNICCQARHAASDPCPAAGRWALQKKI